MTTENTEQTDRTAYWRARAEEAEHDLDIAMEELRKLHPDPTCPCAACVAQ